MAYEINININGDIEDSGDGISQTSSIGGKKTKEKTMDASRLGKYVSSQTIQPFVQKTKDFIVSNVELTTGSKSLQQKVDFAMEGVNMGISAYKNAQAGAIVTSSMGLGGGVGIAIGLTLSAISYGVDVLFKSMQLNREEKAESLQRDYLYRRGGVAFSNSRRGE